MKYYKHDEKEYVPPDKIFNKHKHTDTKGIQGYKNSCYLDATLYGMFMFSDAFDVLLKEKSTTNAEELHLQNMLKSDIVYPLRKSVKHELHTYSSYPHMFDFICTWRKGIVVQEPIEGFREHLARLQDMKGLISEEKGWNHMHTTLLYS